MPIVMQMEWPGVTQEQYDEALRRVNWEADVPTGAIFHVVGWHNGVMQVVDVWQDENDWNHFLNTRLMPAVQQMNIQGEPVARLYPAHRVFDPSKAVATA